MVQPELPISVLFCRLDGVHLFAATNGVRPSDAISIPLQRCLNGKRDCVIRLMRVVVQPRRRRPHDRDQSDKRLQPDSDQLQ
jgi:hypothetical protein